MAKPLFLALLGASSVAHAQSKPFAPKSPPVRKTVPFRVPQGEAPGRAPRLVMAHYMPSSLPLGFNPNNSYWYGARVSPKTDNQLAWPLLLARDDNIETRAYDDEIRLAKSYGIDGFFVDMLEDNDFYRASWTNLVRAAERAGNFYVSPMPDAATLGGDYLEGGNKDYGLKRDKIKRWLDIAGNSPALLRYEGKPVVIEYGNGHPNGDTGPLVKTQFLDWMASQGRPVAFGALFGMDWPLYTQPHAKSPNGYAGIMFATGTFSPGFNDSSELPLFERHLNYFPRETLQIAENRPMYYAPAWFYTGDRLTTGFRFFWEHALSKRDRYRWMQLLTWNDWGESAMCPSPKQFMAWQHLSRFYATWFKTGKQPKITRDYLAVFHRQHPYAKVGTQNPRRVTGDNVTPPADEVEALAFLTKPTIIEITTGGKISRQRVAAGLQSFIVPFNVGVQSARLLRNGKIIAQVTTPVTVSDAPARENLWFVGADSDHLPRTKPLAWTNISGEWNEAASARTGRGLCLSGDEWRDANYAIATTVKANQRESGVISRARGKRGEKHLRFSVRRDGDVLRWKMAQIDGDNASTLDEGAQPLNGRTRVRLRLDGAGEHMSAFIDGKLVSSRATDFELLHGRAGLWAQDDAAFENVRLLSYDLDLSRLDARPF